MPSFNLLAAACASRSPVASAQRLVNLYAEPNQDGTITLYGTPGLRLLATVGSGPIRGLCVANGLLYVVSGSGVYSVDTDLNITLLGTIGTSSGMVSMASNGLKIQLVDGSSSGYLITIADNNWFKITDPDFTGGVTNAFLDGFVLYNEPGTGKFWSTAAYGSGTIDPLDFATAEGAPDPLVSIIVDHREIWLFGSDSTEVWYNAGNPDFPFERISGAFIEHGCAAAFSVAKMDNTVFWLGQDDKGRGMVWRAEGYSPRRVSTHEIETKISNYSRIDDAVSWTYQQDGHSFYVLSFPTEDVTWCYDASTGKWHERASFDNGEFRRHRVSTHAMFNGQHIGGDWENGRLYVLDMGAYTDNGAALVREIITPHFRSGKRAFYSELEVRVESGVGLTTGQGSDPKMSLSISDDGGRTWGSWRTTPIGKLGNYLTRAVFRRLGSGYQKAFRLRISDPVKVAITGARVEFTE